jgi:hypothetical protein
MSSRDGGFTIRSASIPAVRAPNATPIGWSRSLFRLCSRYVLIRSPMVAKGARAILESERRQPLPRHPDHPGPSATIFPYERGETAKTLSINQTRVWQAACANYELSHGLGRHRVDVG